MARQCIIRLDLVCVVFLGGCVGTALRYALSMIPGQEAFHVGTFAANMLACFCYAALSAWLGETNTLALEEFMLMGNGRVAGGAAYCCMTFIIGFAVAYAGAVAGGRFASGERKEAK